MGKNQDKVRKIGKTKFILVFALTFGVWMSLVNSIISMIIKGFIDTSLLYSPAAMGHLTGGFLGGLLMGFVFLNFYKNK